MTLRFLLAVVFLGYSVAFADCGPQQPGETTAPKGLSVVSTLTEAHAQYTALYESGHRISNRAHKDESTQSFVVFLRNKKIRIGSRFIQSITRQIEAALERGYADFLFFTDMGHAHLYMPDSGDTSTVNLESHLEQAELTFLYHTAELFLLKRGPQGALTSDPWLQWRYYTRNFVAKNDSTEALTVLFSKDEFYNTVRDLHDHSSVSTVYMSASHKGCFPFQHDGQTFYFDFTLN